MDFLKAQAPQSQGRKGVQPLFVRVHPQSCSIKILFFTIPFSSRINGRLENLGECMEFGYPGCVAMHICSAELVL